MEKGRGNHQESMDSNYIECSFVLALTKAHVLALNTAHVLRLNKAYVLALNKAHVLRLNTKMPSVHSQHKRGGSY